MSGWELFAKAYAGGVLIGISALLLMLFNGRIAGVSSILGGAIELKRVKWSGRGWRLLFIAGMIFAAFLWQGLNAPLEIEVTAGLAPLVVAGLLVGFGSQLGSGCTSGHGVCGIGRLSARSITATVTFILSGVATVTVVRLFGGL
ncbi:YeeE/YedE family protein [Colwellia sp. C1TZA3]|uniref:YeeE/YedE family protein n=1 Tax=Colwellia sp. C1TZA3 TaxID=2508879 RepID=UPI0011B9CD20|nr:YeeE/YedE family protein [Colwellia sp. C1TZA3]TWX70011.1 YeeE/YedE family protein [Colwellia sp. C1TZA3]